MKHTTSPEEVEVTHLEKLRSQIAADIEAFHQKEASLRDYEQRLRALIERTPANADLDAAVASDEPAAAPVAPATPLNGEALQVAWEKHYRAQSLLEAARRVLSEERLALRDYEQAVQRREEEVARRESWLQAREAELVALAQAKPAEPARKPSLTAAPFVAAMNLFAPKRV